MARTLYTISGATVWASSRAEAIRKLENLRTMISRNAEAVSARKPPDA